MCILDQRIDQTTPNLVDMSTHIQRRDMLNIGLIQPKGGARELIFHDQNHFIQGLAQPGLLVPLLGLVKETTADFPP